MNEYDFQERLKFSMSFVQSDIEIIKRFLPYCKDVIKTAEDLDRKGIDYVAELECGATVFVDVKTRQKGCSKYWKNKIPELALEIWSVCDKKIGWTLSRKSNVDYILFRFDNSDSEKVYFLPFQTLRAAFIRHGHEWTTKYRVEQQFNKTWRSECVFVPVNIVIEAMIQEMQSIYTEQEIINLNNTCAQSA